jgi:hypothetical protein
VAFVGVVLGVQLSGQVEPGRYTDMSEPIISVRKRWADRYPDLKVPISNTSRMEKEGRTPGTRHRTLHENEEQTTGSKSLQAQAWCVAINNVMVDGALPASTRNI